MNTKAHFRVLGTPVRVEPFFWLAAVFLGYRLDDARLIAMFVGVVFVSILVHELGHAIALRAFGQTSSIVLHGFGGLTFSQRRLTKMQSIVVSLAGPGAALALLALPLYLVRESDVGLDLAIRWSEGGSGFGLWPLVVFGATVNLQWSLLNLVPIRPLDGGNVMTQLLGVQRARLLSVVAGVGLAVGLYRFNTGFALSGLFFGFFAFINFSEYQRERQGQRAPSAFDVSAPTPTGGGGAHPGQASGSRPGPVSGSHTDSSGGPVLGRRSSRGRPPMAPAPPPPTTVDPATAEATAWNLLRRADAAGAARTLARASGPVGPFVAPTIAAATGDIGPLVDAYRTHPDGPSNLVPVAVAHDTGQLVPLVEALLADGAGAQAVVSIQTHLHYGDRHQAAATVGERLFASGHGPRAQVAFDTACGWARAGQIDRALTWIRMAVDVGFDAPALLDGEPDLRSVRADPRWGAVRSGLG